jgi:hypothetical protein
MTDPSAALAAVLERVAGMKSGAIIHEIGPTGGTKGGRTLDEFMARWRRATLTDERTTFIIGDRAAFGSLATSRRAVVLTARELELAHKKFGPIMPIDLSLFVLDHEARRGYVIWDASWVGGTIELEKRGGQWVAKDVGSWITWSPGHVAVPERTPVAYHPGAMRTRKPEPRYVVCVQNAGYKASLVVRRSYQVVPDPQAEKRGLCRVIDESGQDYLYPKKLFAAVDLPSALSRKFAVAT